MFLIILEKLIDKYFLQFKLVLQFLYYLSKLVKITYFLWNIKFVSVCRKQIIKQLFYILFNLDD